MTALPKGLVSARVLSSTMDFSVFLGVLIVFAIADTVAQQNDKTDTYDMLYRSGVDGYNNRRWLECAKYMTAALADHKAYHNVLIDCRLNCQQESKTDIDKHLHTDLAFFDITLKLSDCIRRCKKKHLRNRPEMVNDKIVEDFKNLEPYNYLQLCAYKLENYEQAASSAYTYLLAHPDHPQMKNNMVFYKAMPEIKQEYFVNLEAKGYQVKYQEGVEAYGEAQYSDVILAMEEALTLYYTEARRCDVMCEGPYDHEGLPDQANAIADHYVHVLECRVGCPTKMATFMGKEVYNYLPEHYNYLQYSYYKADQVDKACEAAATYLHLDPTNKEMLDNRKFFLGVDGITEDSFIPRQEAVIYHERRTLEVAQLNYVRTSYTFADSDLDVQGTAKRRVRKYEAALTPLKFGARDATYREVMRRHLKEGISITLEGKALQGPHRVVVDNFVTQEQADKLVELAAMASTQGDGYEGREHRSSPHTDFEKFEGMTIMKAATLAKFDLVPDDLAALYLTISEKMRAFLEDYWNLASPLFFHFTHLVCRTALEAKDGMNQKVRKDLSHPVHSDNCHIRDDGSCPKLPPAYVARDVSAVLYLNQGFEGGNFFFAHHNLSVQQTVVPRTSRMVAFEAGDFHGVEAVTKGRRCALALWFTMSELDAEKAHREATAILRHKAFMKTLKNPMLRTIVEEEHIRIVKTEVELNGPERFAADQVVSKEDCEILIALANVGGKVGDGYSDMRTEASQSPHTVHEKFAALTVNTAAELAAEGKVDLDAVELYLKVAEKGRKLVETYFKLKTKLYFDFTHLVCRTALHDETMERTDLSHPVHSDNCILQPDGSCKREPPAYVQRDYSAIIYLNGEFKGGEIFFTHSNLTVQSSLKPHEGMLVGFQAGNFHGVTAVEAGQRCAIALWYTLNPKFNEKAHLIAHRVISELRAKAESAQPQHEEL